MKLKNILIVVNDIEKSKQFYRALFGLNVVLESNGNVILTEGLVLQDKSIWKEAINGDVSFHSNSSELYFEEREIEVFVEKLERLYPDVQYTNRLSSNNWERKFIRFYDLDGNLIEVGSSV